MILIKNGRIIDPKRGTDETSDLIIDERRIYKIGNSLSGDGFQRIIDAKGMIVAPGFIDVHVHFRDPGFTHKEDIHTGAKSAAKGGFTTVVCMANTKPPVDNVETLDYIIEEGRKTGINVLTTAAVTMGLKGEVLTDMETLKAHGAVGFTDDGYPIMDSVLVKKAMEESARLNMPISFHEEDPKLIYNPGINRGSVSEKLGIGGSPAIAEDTLVARDCMVALHTGASVNIQHISSKNSVRMVKLAKELGADVTAEVTPHHFTLDEEAVLQYGTLAKMNPPLRTKEDRTGLIEGLKDGSITIIATDHAPHSREEKGKTITEAPSGITGLETVLALGVTELVRKEHITVMKLMELMSLNPAKLYRLDRGSIEEGAVADIVIFDENERWKVDGFASKSVNSPFTGWDLYGKVKYTICNGKVVYQDETV